MTPWTTIRTGTASDGAYLQLRYSECGRGRVKVRAWKIFRDGAPCGYAACDADVEPNWERAVHGLVRDTFNGCWVVAGPRTCPDICPACGYDLAAEGYPAGHQTDSDGQPCAFTWSER